MAIASIMFSKGLSRIRISLAVWIALACLPGCWDSREIEELGFILGAAIDVTDNRVELTYQHMIPEKTKKNSYKNVTTTAANSIQTASREQAKQVASHPTFQFIRIILISDEAIRRMRLDELLDTFTRSYQTSRKTRVVIVKGHAKDALQVFTTDKERDIPSIELDKLSKNEDLTAKMPEPLTLGDISKKFAQEADFMLQTVEPQQERNQMSGAAIISGKNRRLIGWLNEEEVAGVNWMLGKTGNTIVESQDPETGKPLIFEVQKVASKLNPRMQDEKLSFTVKIKTVADLTEGWVDPSDVTKKPFLQIAEKAAQESIRQSILRALEKLQKTEKADVAGFGKSLKVHLPDVWDRNKEVWPDTFSGLSADVQVEVQIGKTGAYSTKGENP